MPLSAVFIVIGAREGGVVSVVLFVCLWNGLMLGGVVSFVSLDRVFCVGESLTGSMIELYVTCPQLLIAVRGII